MTPSFITDDERSEEEKAARPLASMDMGDWDLFPAAYEVAEPGWFSRTFSKFIQLFR
jgi:hypothetical protein